MFCHYLFLFVWSHLYSVHTAISSIEISVFFGQVWWFINIECLWRPPSSFHQNIFLCRLAQVSVFRSCFSCQMVFSNSRSPVVFFYKTFNQIFRLEELNKQSCEILMRFLCLYFNYFIISWIIHYLCKFSE